MQSTTRIAAKPGRWFPDCSEGRRTLSAEPLIGLRRAVSFAPPGLAHVSDLPPTAYAVGCIFSPLRGLGPNHVFPSLNAIELRHTRYGTLTVIVEEVRPYWLVAYSVYVVVAVGFTVALVPRTAPRAGETMT